MMTTSESYGTIEFLCRCCDARLVSFPHAETAPDQRDCARGCAQIRIFKPGDVEPIG
jgi:hypothetical protein